MDYFNELKLDYAAREIKNRKYTIKKEVIEKRKLNITEKDIVTLEVCSVCECLLDSRGLYEFTAYAARIKGKLVEYTDIDKKDRCPSFSIQDVIRVA